MLNRLKHKLVMAFNLNNVKLNNAKEEPLKAPLPASSLDLTKSEIETLLVMVKESHFKGEHVQKVYELVLKLQNYYSQLP
jgi:hypothetical protein